MVKANAATIPDPYFLLVYFEFGIVFISLNYPRHSNVLPLFSSPLSTIRYVEMPYHIDMVSNQLNHLNIHKITFNYILASNKPSRVE